MPASRADYHLLAGTLALQLDFVTRDQWLAAAAEWTRDRETPLAAIFRRQGVLSAEECDLLSALVDRHLARHGNDPQRSLAACEASPAARELLESLTESPQADTAACGLAPVTDPHATTTRQAKSPTIRAPLLAPDPFKTSAVETPPPGAMPTMADASAPTLDFPRDAKSISWQPLSQPAAVRYRVIRTFSRGGLGQVSLAHDEELNREIALKEILPKYADDDEARQRFLVEAEITGSLEHPGVVPVYGLGQYGDGRPFYAMRLIRGDNLQLAIEQFHGDPDAPDRELRFRQLLGRFIDVCNAIEYAHNRCVLHRDLKPGNIMLGKYGETLVVDWGLAKPMNAPGECADAAEQPVQPASAVNSTATQMGRVVGTPAYMSPEQASGRVDLLGPATDIYSLGATLYHLLAGQPPFGTEERDELLGNVQMGLFPSPRSVRPDAPRPLEAVCLKAMARGADQRYPSAHALADDVERYLADEPVSAYAESFVARLWRWMRKRRALVLSSAAILTVVAAALAIGVVLLQAANLREQRLRRVADQQRNRAEHNFELARDAVRDYYITVSEDTLLDQPGMQPLRDELLQQALAYYRQFLESGEDQRALRGELAQANYFVGRITETIGSPAEAIPYYEQASKLAAELATEAPKDPERQYELGRALNALGNANQKLGQLPAAQNFYRQAEELRQRLIAAHPDNAEYVRTLANTIMNRGSIDAELGNSDAAITAWQGAQALRLARLAHSDDDPRLRADAGKGDFNLGLFYLDHGDAAAAERHLLDAARSFERVGELAPNDLDSQYRLAVSYRTLGDLQPIDSAAAKAREYYAKAYDLLATLSLRSPQVREYKADLGGMQLAVAEMLLDEEKADDALTAIEKAFKPLEELVAAHPDVLLYQRDLAVALRVRGQIHLKQGNAAAAKADLARSVELLQKLTAAAPDDEDFRSQLEQAEAL